MEDALTALAFLPDFVIALDQATMTRVEIDLLRHKVLLQTEAVAEPLRPASRQ